MKQNSLSNQYQHLTLAPEVYNHLRGLQKKTKDLKSEVKTLRRLAQSQAIAVREDIKDTFMRIRATLLATSGTHWGQNDQERVSQDRKEICLKKSSRAEVIGDTFDLRLSGDRKIKTFILGGF